MLLPNEILNFPYYYTGNIFDNVVIRNNFFSNIYLKLIIFDVL